MTTVQESNNGTATSAEDAKERAYVYADLGRVLKDAVTAAAKAAKITESAYVRTLLARELGVAESDLPTAAERTRTYDTPEARKAHQASVNVVRNKFKTLLAQAYRFDDGKHSKEFAKAMQDVRDYKAKVLAGDPTFKF